MSEPDGQASTSSGKLVTPDTLRHHRQSSTDPYTSNTVYHESLRIEASKEMNNKFFGPVHPEFFLREFLNINTPPLPGLAQFVQKFEECETSKEKGEVKLYDPFIKAITPFCKGIVAVKTAMVADPDSGVFLEHNISPDISVYREDYRPTGGEPITCARKMTCFGEFKVSNEDDPFDDGRKDQFEKDTLAAHGTRGQLIFYATAIQALQYRTHVFSFFIQQPNCRLMFWTRSGAVVTNAFDYTKHDWLLQLFWRISHATEDARGIDTTFARIADDGSETEAQNAQRELHAEDTDPLFKVSVENNGQTTYYIVSKPFVNRSIYPIGRGTRCFQAYCCKTKKVVLLKDVWRVDSEGYDPEGDTYNRLHKAGVRNIAKLLAAGDVPGPTNRCGETFEHTLCGEVKLRTHQHYRLVIDVIGRSLENFSSTWEMVNAVYHAAIAHQDAVKKARILHRDISVGNIPITETEDGQPAGILIDWELTKDIDVKEPRSDDITGTWQFISARLLLKEIVEHSTGDDLESFAYVIGWVAARYAPSTMSVGKRSVFLIIFDEVIDKAGGISKVRSLCAGGSDIRGLKFQQMGCTDTLVDLWNAFGCRYESEFYMSTLEQQGKEAARQLQDRLESHDWMLELLKTMLNNQAWREARDTAVNNLIIKSNKMLTEQQRKCKSQMPTKYPDYAQKYHKLGK